MNNISYYIEKYLHDDENIVSYALYNAFMDSYKFEACDDKIVQSIYSNLIFEIEKINIKYDTNYKIAFSIDELKTTLLEYYRLPTKIVNSKKLQYIKINIERKNNECF